MIEIRHATLVDIRRLGDSPISESFHKQSLFSWVGLADGEIACIWGLIAPTVLSESAYLWLITTSLVDEHKFIFVRHSQLIIHSLLEDFPRICGHVLAGQERSKRWLKWLGVTFYRR